MVHLKSLFRRSSSYENVCPYDPNRRRPEFPPYDHELAEVYRHRRHIGVNLGSIFILNKEGSPASVRSSIVKDDWESELDFLEACTSEKQAREALEDHWSQYINEKDFELFASVGVNAVRIPIGYWTLGPEYNMGGSFKKYTSVYCSAWHYFLKMVKMASDYKIGVLVSLHGAPGGQNTQTNCGTSSRKAQFFKHSNQELTLKIFKKLTTELAPINNVIGLELLHEPDDDPSLYQFYIDAIRIIRSATPSIVLPIYMSDSFHTKKYADFIKDNNFDFVILDVHYPLKQQHHEENFKRRQQRPTIGPRRQSQAVTSGILKQKDVLRHYSNQLRGNMIVGEWSLTKHDYPSEDQIKIYNQIGSGHFFCNYRTIDDASESSFIFCHKAGLFSDVGIIPKGQTLVIEQAIEDAYNKHITSVYRQEDKYYQQGFTDGYTVSLQFLDRLQSRIGLKEQLACTWSKRKFGQYNTPYKYGFVTSLSLIDQVITEYITKSLKH